METRCIKDFTDHNGVYRFISGNSYLCREIYEGYELVDEIGHEIKWYNGHFDEYFDITDNSDNFYFDEI